MWTDFQNSFTSRFIRKFSMYTPQDFHLICNVLLVEVQNPKILTGYWTNCWHVPENTLSTFNSRLTDCHKAADTGWLTNIMKFVRFWSLSDDVSNQLNVVASWWFFYQALSGILFWDAVYKLPRPLIKCSLCVDFNWSRLLLQQFEVF